jgi:hypothetical protein
MEDQRTGDESITDLHRLQTRPKAHKVPLGQRVFDAGSNRSMNESLALVLEPSELASYERHQLNISYNKSSGIHSDSALVIELDGWWLAVVLGLVLGLGLSVVTVVK